MRYAMILIALLTVQGLLYSAIIKVPADYLTIQEAIDAARDGDTVLVSPGSYPENIYLKGKAVTLTSTDGPEYTFLLGGDHGNWYHQSCIIIESGEGPETVLDGFTMKDGNGCYFSGSSDRVGGGIVCDNNSSPVIRNNIITLCRADYGAGIYCNDGSSPTIMNNIITDNFCYKPGAGAGIFCDYSSSPLIENNEIILNEVGSGVGGGICCYRKSSPTIVENIITDNYTLYDGGGICCWSESSPG
jgi:hypothetical protein